MAKNSKHAAQRAKKKNEKDKKRKTQALARRRDDAFRAAAAAEIRARQKAGEDVYRDWKPELEGIHGLALRTRRSVFETARTLEHLVHHGTALPDYIWTSTRVRALPTEELVAKLAALGITADRERFLEGTRQDISALAFWEREWEPGVADTTHVRELDFAALATCDLWRRWQPERPSSQMLLDLLIDSDEARHHEDFALAAEKSLELWSRLREVLPGTRTIAQAQDRIGVKWDFVALVDELYEHTDAAREKRPDLLARTATALDQVLAEMTDIEEAVREEWTDYRLDLGASGQKPALTAGP
jgi:hypothetical protein